ncbi:MAG: TauD/TfdA family dioxygenase [Alphaproteobacteria bacterium]|nr:TauD/TfdA family dioxygenase [Alphaproteobacteria bacterium]
MSKSRKETALPSETTIEWKGGDVQERADEAKEILNSQGFVVVTDLPQKPDVRVGSSLVSAAFWDMASAIGQPKIYPGQADGEFVSNLRPNKAAFNGEVSYQTSNEFNVHTDLAYLRLRPRYMGMFVVKQDFFGEALSELAPVDEAACRLNEKTLDILCKENFDFVYPARAGETIAAEFKKALRASILEEAEGGFYGRYRRDTLIGLNPAAIGAADEFSKKLNIIKKSFLPQKNSAVFVDNWKVLHARTAFTPTYDENDRHIQRVYLDI